MREAVRRSVARSLDDDRDLLPDLLILDGGRGQLGAAQKALDDLDLDPAELPLVGLAKARLKGLRDSDARDILELLRARLGLEE